MASESELRDAIRSSANITATGIDTEAVVRRARARRVPKQLAFSSLSVLAIAGIATLGITVLPTLQSGLNGAADSSIMSTMPESMQGEAGGGAGGDATSESTEKHFDARELTQNLCGTATVSTAPNSAGLVLSVTFPDFSPADGLEVAGTVSLTNTGTSPVSGTTAITPSVSVSRDGITVWHSHGAMRSVGVVVDLEPGQSSTYDAHFTPVECGPKDDEGEQFRDNLPALNAGNYTISAEIVFIPDGAETGEGILVGGPVQNIELH